ncbi:hypothetical protein A2U01_0019261, partial [Trifolium medium]|nr:hypothetical protein [Trifolium medium]
REELTFLNRVEPDTEGHAKHFLWLKTGAWRTRADRARKELEDAEREDSLDKEQTRVWS